MTATRTLRAMRLVAQLATPMGRPLYVVVLVLVAVIALATNPLPVPEGVLSIEELLRGESVPDVWHGVLLTRIVVFGLLVSWIVGCFYTDLWRAVDSSSIESFVKMSLGETAESPRTAQSLVTLLVLAGALRLWVFAWLSMGGLLAANCTGVIAGTEPMVVFSTIPEPFGLGSSIIGSLRNPLSFWEVASLEGPIYSQAFILMLEVYRWAIITFFGSALAVVVGKQAVDPHQTTTASSATPSSRLDPPASL